METRGKARRWRYRIALVATALIGGSVLFAAPSSASHPEVSLPGSDFEIDTNANLKVDDPSPSIDWASVSEDRKADQPTGATDDSFGQGTKEDTAVPTVVDGSIPPNKSDLLNFGVYLERTSSGARFLHVFWHRVQEPQGTTNMDFEFNQSSTVSGNGVTPVRTAGDLLIQYDLAQGGTNPQLFLSRWVTSGSASQCNSSNTVPCWGTRVNLSSAGDATGSINTTAIPATESEGLGNVSARTFGEASIDFDAIAGGSQCVAFGSAYLKSRSSDSFTAALKDFIAPQSVNISQCGSIKIVKTDDATTPSALAGAEFDLRRDEAPVGGSPGVEDPVIDSCTTDAAGECTFLAVLQGDYWVVETVAPPGHDLASPAFQHVTVTADEEVTVTFVDPRQRGAILITKTRKLASTPVVDDPHPGVTFTVTDDDTVVGTGQTDENGQLCVDGLLFGDYDVTETVPDNYAAAGATTQTVTVDTKGSCGPPPANAEEVSFENIPLTNLTVTVDSQVPGGTSSTIDCGSAGSVPGGEDITLNANDLQPGTYTCTIVVDP